MNDNGMNQYRITKKEAVINGLGSGVNAIDAELELENESGEKKYLHVSKVFDTEYTVTDESILQAIQNRPKTEELMELYPLYLAARDPIPVSEYYKSRQDADQSAFRDFWDRLDAMVEEQKEYLRNHEDYWDLKNIR